MRTRIALVVAGAAVITYGTLGALTDDAADPAGMAVFLLAVLVAHDAVWMPAVLGAGYVITRLVPARHRNAVRAAALSGAALAVVALPLVLGRGRPADNPSVLPLPYGRHLALILLAVALAPVVRGVFRKKSERTRGGGTGDGDG
jgi:hypothetical protein